MHNLIRFIILFISAISFIFCQNDGQPPLFINISPIETFYNNSNIEIETQVTDISPLSKVILYYKFSDDNGYSSIIMDKEINYFASIPSNDISGEKLKYYFFAEDVYGNQSLYPENGEENPLLININNTLDDNIYQDVEVNLLEPLDKSQLFSIPIIIVSLYKQDSNINLNDISVLIDDFDITSDCMIDNNMITFIPIKLYSPGEHTLSILFKSRKIKYMQKDFSFFIKEKIESEQFKAMNYIEQYSIKASFGYDSDFDEYFNKVRPDTRPLDTHKLNASVSFRLGQYKVKLSSLFTGYLFDTKFQENKIFKQPIDRLKFSIENNNFTIKYGDHSSDFSSLTLKGVRVRGLHTSYESDKFKSSLVIGNLKEPIQSYYNFNSDSTGWLPIVLGFDSTYYNYTKGTPTRELSAFRTEYIYKSKFNIGLSFLSAYDILAGIDIWDPTLYDEYELLGNAVAGLDFTYFIDNKKGWIKGESALSITNNLLDSTDIIIDTLNIGESTLIGYEDFLGFPITNDAVLGTAEGRGISVPFPSLDDNGNPIVDLDYIFNDLIKKGAHTFSFKKPFGYRGNTIDLQGSYRHIPPNFVSFGSGSVQKDIEGFKSTLKMKLLNNQFSLNFGYDDENDNLLGDKPTEKLKNTTTSTASSSFGLGININSLTKLEKLIAKIMNRDEYKIDNIPTLNYSIKIMERQGLDVFSELLTTSTITTSHTITPSFKFNISDIDFEISNNRFNFNSIDINMNGNILLMNFMDDFSIDTASTNYSSSSISGGASVKLNPPISISINETSFDFISPISINIGGGYSNNVSEDPNKKDMIFKLFNTKISYKFFEQKLSSFVGLSYVKGTKKEDIFSPEVNNSKATMKFGLQYKIWDKTSIGFNLDYLIINDVVNIENKYSELKGKIKFKMAL